MAGDDAQYEFRSVRTVRGMEARTIAKLGKEGWDFVSEDQGPLLQTKMTFRRAKPKLPWKLIAAAAGGLLILGVGAGVSAILGGGSDAVSAATPTEGATSTGERPSEEPSDEPIVQPSTQPPETPRESAESAPSEAESEETLTIENNAELAALLAGSDTGGNVVEGFAAKYVGRAIEFDGNIAYMTNHDSYKTRYDLLIAPGDYSETSKIGPNFQFRDINVVSDLRLKGPNIPDTIGAGQNLHIIARVESFNPAQELFFLEPISTEVR